MLSKKILATVMGALMLMACAIPSLAFAAESPSLVTVGPVSGTAKTGETVTLTVQYTGQQGWLIVEPWDQPAANFPAGDSPFITYQVRESWPGAICGEGGVIPGGLLLTFNFGEKYSGYAAKVYIDHDNGADEVRNSTVSANGSISINVDRLSLFSVELTAPEEGSSATASNKSVDKTTTSPGTGTGMVPVALLASAACIGGAALCFSRIRRED